MMTTHLVKGTLVPIFLQELLLTLGFLLPQFMCSLQIFLHSLFFGHCPPPLDLLAFFFPAKLLFLFCFDSSQLPQSPCLEFSSRV